MGFRRSDHTHGGFGPVLPDGGTSGRGSLTGSRPNADDLPEFLCEIADGLRVFNFRESCVYFLIDGPEVVYIGQTGNLGMRMFTHVKNKAFDQVVYMPCHKEILDEIEAEFIRLFTPKYNNRGNERFSELWH